MEPNPLLQPTGLLHLQLMEAHPLLHMEATQLLRHHARYSPALQCQWLHPHKESTCQASRRCTSQLGTQLVRLPLPRVTNELTN